MLASMAKLKAGRLRREVSDACLQYWGGAGYLWDSPWRAPTATAAGLDRRRRRRGDAADHRQADGQHASIGEPIMQFTQEHAEIRRTLRAIIDKDINPQVDQWEEDGIFPAHEVFKKLGNAGLLGINKPVEFGGMGLDYSYAMVMAEELGHIACGSGADGDRRADRHGDPCPRPLRQRRAAG
jgi:alkylation response protein AidB-like acyl-CoA dehydrogenase